MKVVCVKNEDEGYHGKTTIGKTYELFKFDEVEIFFYIDDDDRKILYFESEDFIPLEQWRNSKLTNLGI